MVVSAHDQRGMLHYLIFYRKIKLKNREDKIDNICRVKFLNL